MNDWRRLLGMLASGLALGVTLMSAGCGGAASASQRTAHSADSAPALNIRLEVDRYEFTTPASMCSAALVALVTVSGQGAPQWNTANGSRPTGATEASVIRDGYAIYTPVYFSGMTVYLDHRRQATKEFATVGGRVGQDQYAIDELPQVAVGLRYVIVFAQAHDPATRSTVESTLLVYDAFPITAQGVVILQPAGSAHEPGPGQPQPAITMPLSQLAQQLATCQ